MQQITFFFKPPLLLDKQFLLGHVWYPFLPRIPCLFFAIPRKTQVSVIFFGPIKDSANPQKAKKHSFLDGPHTLLEFRLSSLV